LTQGFIELTQGFVELTQSFQGKIW
jgi:hypothetical protein